MADKTTDSLNKEQVVHCSMPETRGQQLGGTRKGCWSLRGGEHQRRTLVSVLLHVLQRLNQSIHNVLGQCCDDASSMSGRKGGVAKQLCDRERKALYKHCYGHAINLACNDSIQQCKLMRDALYSCQEIIKLVEFSPRHDCVFSSSRQVWPKIIQVQECCVPYGGQ